MPWLALLAAYLLGSLSGSLLLGRLVGVDIRTRGSGNAGGTNAFRTLGAKFALGVLLIDVGKGALAAALGRAVDAPDWSAGALPYGCVAAAVLGHIWPVFFGFRGGKGVGTLLGGVLVLWPAAALWLAPLWLGVLVATGYVSLASVLAVAGLVPLALWQDDLGAPVRIAFAVAAAAGIAFTHRANLARLRQGSEHRFERVRFWRRGRGAAP